MRPVKRPKNWNCLTAAYIAAMLNVSERTVYNWIYRSGLKAWTIPTPGAKRKTWRVTVQELAMFCKRSGIPIPDEIRSVLAEKGYSI